MLHRLTTAAAAALLALAGTARADTVNTDIIGTDGENIGTLTINAAPTGVLLTIDINPGSLEPGWHGVHLHAVGDCSDTGTFKKSGDHINPSGNKHGLLNPDGPDNGDLPNLFAADDGSATAQMFNARVGLTGDAALLDDDGSALVVHAGPDDGMTQPIGGAGDRVACAEIAR